MINFGKRVELLTDGYLIDSMDGLRFRYEKPEKLGMVLPFDRPWEKKGSLGLSVIDDGGRVMLYYRGFPGDDRSDYDEKQTSCLALSEDGVRFERAAVNRIDYDGIRENNIVRMDINCHNFAPFLDTNPACRPGERFKAIGGLLSTGGLRAWSSPDGIDWTLMAEGPVITDGVFDSMNMAFYDTEAGVYRAYFRTWSDEGYSGWRCISSAESKDFLHWGPTIPNEYPGVGICEHLYTNAARPIPGAEHMLISMPMRFMETRTLLPDYKTGPGVSDMLLMTSRDGHIWDRPVRDAFIRGGLYSHEWTQRCFIPLGGIIPRGDRFLFYAEQNYMWDDDGIFAYAVPRFRFMSLWADGQGGVLRTKTLHFERDDIFLNFSTSAYGCVKVRIADSDGGELFASDEIYGNDLSRPLHVDGLAGKSGRMEITLREADLYALGSAMT